MTASLPALLATGLVLGWSVAWPPGPINAEIARRCAAGDFWAGIAVLVGASSVDAVWAVAVALRVGLLFAAPLARRDGVVSIALLLALAYLFLRGAWRAFARGDPPEAKPEAKAPLHLSVQASPSDVGHSAEEHSGPVRAEHACALRPCNWGENEASEPGMES